MCGSFRKPGSEKPEVVYGFGDFGGIGAGVFAGVFPTGCASMDTVSCAEWMWVPEEPSTVMNAVVGTTEAAELKLRLCVIPGVTCRAAGEAVIPGGRPVTSTVIGEENPLAPVADRETEPDAPAGKMRLDGETDRLKS